MVAAAVKIVAACAAGAAGQDGGGYRVVLQDWQVDDVLSSQYPTGQISKHLPFVRGWRKFPGWHVTQLLVSTPSQVAQE